MKIVLLNAGLGNRMSSAGPKCLLELTGGPDPVTILDRQLGILRKLGPVFVVVGHQKEKIMNGRPDLAFVENAEYAVTNTAPSLLLGLEAAGESEGVLWVNGDVVFDPRVAEAVAGSPFSCVAVHRRACGDEEVKYRTDGSGRVVSLSKTTVMSEGEALGVNLVLRADIGRLKEGLRLCNPADYFERGVEYAIERGMRVDACDVTEFPCIEIDFPEDLASARETFRG